MHPDGFHLAFSGGKDSQVLYHLAQMAGVKFKAHMQITTLDPPELLRFIRANYPDVELHRPPLNFCQLLEKKGSLPTRKARWCCEALKEYAGAGCVTLLGVRAAESVRRAKRSEVEKIHRDKNKRNINGIFDDTSAAPHRDLFDVTYETEHQCAIDGRDKIVVSPIFRWSDAEVWEFIRGNNIHYCELYNRGWKRIGCLLCPIARKSERARERVLYPGVERAIVRSIDRILQDGRMKPVAPYNPSAQEVFDWWMSGKSVKKYFGMLRNQTKLDL